MRRADYDKAISRGQSQDMSPKAIERRLDIVSELRALTQFLGTARRVKSAKDAPGNSTDPNPK
jgi:hypothetical protein